MNDTNIIMLGCGLVDRPTQLFYLDIYLLSFWWGPLWGCGTSFQWLKAGQVRSFLKLVTYVYVGDRNAKNGKKRAKTQEKALCKCTNLKDTAGQSASCGLNP